MESVEKLENIKSNEWEELEEDTQKDRFLTFGIESENYGIEVEYVTEIIGMQDVTEVPSMPHYIKGIINLRGKIIPVMDVSLRFGKKEKIYDDRTCIIVMDKQDLTIGLIVDKVCEVSRIQETTFPPCHEKGNNYFIKGIGNVESGIKLLIDWDKLLLEEENTQGSYEGGKKHEMV